MSTIGTSAAPPACYGKKQECTQRNETDVTECAEHGQCSGEGESMHGLSSTAITIFSYLHRAELYGKCMEPTFSMEGWSMENSVN